MERNDGTFGKSNWISVANMYYQTPDKVASNNIGTRTYVLRRGDMAFEGHPKTDFKYGRFVVDDIGDGVISELFPIYRHIGKYDNDYWKFLVQRDDIMSKILINCIEISFTSSNKLDEDAFLAQGLFVADLREQIKIGHIFEGIADAIVLHQRVSFQIALAHNKHL